MANAPDLVPMDYSTLELVQHHPDFKAKNVEISNGVYGKERFSTLESAPNSPDLDSKGNRYSTLEPYSPGHDANEKIGAGLHAIAETSESPKKENWKRRRLCGVPLLMLLIGLVVLVAVVAAVVGGVVGSKKKSDDPKLAPEQNETPVVVTVTQTEQIVGGATVSYKTSTGTRASTPATASATSSSTPKSDEPWLTGLDNSIITIKGYQEYMLSDNGGDVAGLQEQSKTSTEDKFKWLITKVSADDQEIYEESYPWAAEGPTQAYNIIPVRAGSKPMYLTLDPDVATAKKIDTSGATIKEIPLGIFSQLVTDRNPSARAWYFRSTTKEEVALGEYPLKIYNVFFGPRWKLGINNSSNYAPQLQFDDQGIAEEFLWKLSSPEP